MKTTEADTSEDEHAGERSGGRFRMLVVAADTYPPARVDVAVLFGEHLAHRGHRIDWILQSGAECRAAHVARWGACKVWVGPTDLGSSLLNRVHKHVLGVLHDLKVFSLARRAEYDIIGVKDRFISAVCAAAAARVFRKRFIYWLSFPFPENYLYRAMEGTARYPFLYRVRGVISKFLLYRVLLPAADHVFVQSEQMRRDVAAEGVPMSRTTAVPMGVELDPEPLQALTGVSRIHVPIGEKCFLYLGSLAKVRRLDFLVRVLAEVCRQVPGAKLYLVGSGNDPSDERLLTDEAERLGVLRALVLVGSLPRKQALEYVRDADVCVSPIYPTPIFDAASPTKLVEYMAMGRAVVANDQPEQRLVLQESRAGYCVPWEEHAFAQAIVRLLEDPGTAEAMGERGRRYVAENRAYAKIADLVERQLLALGAAG